MKSDALDELRPCAAYQDLLVDLSDGELPAEQRQRVESHTAKCAGCRAELVRLNASLVVLRRTGFQPVQDGTRSMAATYCCAAGLSLALLIGVGVAAFRFTTPGRAPTMARAAPERSEFSPPLGDAVAEKPAQPPVLDEAAIFRHIAVAEQQARLQASLDLMPKDPWFAEQRAANEELLAKFKASTTDVQISSDRNNRHSGT